MIDRQALSDFVEQKLKDTGCFLTDVKVTPDNQITVEIDSMNAVDIDECVSLTRAIDACVELSRAVEAEFDRDKEDYELEVGSAGLTSPLRVPRQYEKHIGHDVEVLTNDGRKIHGMLKEADAEGFTVATERKVKPEGAKRPVTETVEERFGYGDVKHTKYDLKF